jgi:soluble lytic murein transglycosylase-like protein
MPPDRFWYVNHSCVVAAANRYAVTVQILEAIILVESEGDPHAVNVNRDGKGDRRGPLSFKQATDLVAELWKVGANFDVGIAQINSVHMRQYKIDPVHFLDPCINIQWAAFVLRQKINEYQETWTAVGRYNGSRNIAGYSWKVYRALRAPRRHQTSPWVAAMSPRGEVDGFRKENCEQPRSRAVCHWECVARTVGV